MRKLMIAVLLSIVALSIPITFAHAEGPEDIITETFENATATQTITLKSVTSKQSIYTYNGAPKKPAITVKDMNGNTVKAANYTVRYANNTNAGQAKIQVTGKNGYKGTVETTFTIKPSTVHRVVGTPNTTTYNGTQKNVVFAPTGVNGETLSTFDYRVIKTPSGRTDVGAYTYTIKYISNYTGTETFTLTILPTAPRITSGKSTPWNLGLNFNDVPGVDGYELQYAYNGDFKNAKTITQSKPKMTWMKYNGNRRIYVRMRSFATINGKKEYSKWGVRSGYSSNQISGKPTITRLQTVNGNHKLTWKKRNVIDGYIIYRKPVGSGSWKAIKTIKNPNTTSVTLGKSGKYGYKIATYYKGGNITYTSQYSTVVTYKDAK